MIFRHLLSLVLFLVSGLVVSGATRVVVTPEVPGEVPAELKISLPGIRLTQIAEHPQVVTPTGIDVDEKGRVWVVSSHTHFRPEGYPGP